MSGPTLISRYLDTVGDGSGTKNAIGNYADAGLGATQFLIAPDAGETIQIARMIVSYEDTKNWNSDLYGQGITLTNGISVHVEGTSGLRYNLTDPDNPVLTNGNWASYCYDFSLFAFGTGEDWAAVRWTFAKSGSTPTLRGDEGEKLIVTLNDDFSALTFHGFLVQGKVVRS